MIDATKIKRISIAAYLQHINHPFKERGGRLYCCASIVRPGATDPNHLQINLQRNLWIDRVTGQGGSIIDLVMLHRRCSYANALRFLEEWGGEEGVSNGTLHSFPTAHTHQKVEVVRAEPLHRPMWIDYLKERCIDTQIASKYLSEVVVRVENYEKSLYGVGWKTGQGSWQVRTKMAKFSKISTFPATFSVMLGEMDEVLMFEGMFDFLSFLTIAKKSSLAQTSIVLNSTANVGKAVEWIREHAPRVRVRCYFDNDDAGTMATEIVQNAFDLVTDCRHAYKDFNDINDFCKNLFWSGRKGIM